MSGKKNSFTATLYPTGHEKKVIYTIDGQWTDSFTIHEGGAKGTVVETHDAKSNPTTPLNVAPLEQQGPLESRRAWSKVAAGIAKGDMDTTGAEKGKIEDEQRAMRKKEQEEKREWQRKYFNRLDKDADFDKLAAAVSEPLEAEKTGGVWRFNSAAATAPASQAL